MKIEIIKGDNNPVSDFFSSPSNTPETDAEFYGINAFCKEDRKLNAMTSYARKLESERDEAREKAERYRLEANAMMLQRDEAREALKHIGEYGTEEINAAVELRQKLASALVERDEAQIECLEQARLLGMSSEREAKLISDRDEARKKYDNLATEHMLVVNKLCNERDEAKSISDELAIIASLCLGWHDHESNDTAIKIVAALKRWKKSKVSNEQD